MGVSVNWYAIPTAQERLELGAWLAETDCSDVAIIAIDTSVVMVEGVGGWGASELRSRHETLGEALAAAVRRLRLQ